MVSGCSAETIAGWMPAPFGTNATARFVASKSARPADSIMEPSSRENLSVFIVATNRCATVPHGERTSVPPRGRQPQRCKPAGRESKTEIWRPYTNSMRVTNCDLCGRRELSIHVNPATTAAPYHRMVIPPLSVNSFNPDRKAVSWALVDNRYAVDWIGPQFSFRD